MMSRREDAAMGGIKTVTISISLLLAVGDNESEVTLRDKVKHRW